MRSTVVRACAIGLLTVSPWAAGAPVPPRPAATRVHWTRQDPDAMIDAAREHAGTGDANSITALTIIEALADRASYGKAGLALEAIASNERVSGDVRDEASLGVRRLSPNVGSPAATADNQKLGIVTDLVLLGPFRDIGGGLDRHEGPEAPGGSFSDRSARYSWGSIEVAWRILPPAFIGADGVPLDLFIEPRSESCSYVATTLSLPSAQSIVVRLAGSGQVRLMFDGTTLGRSEQVHYAAHFDRIASRVDAEAGNHLVYAKVCAGALDDEGRVRIRITDSSGKPLSGQSTVQLARSGKAPTTMAIETPLARALRDGSSLDAQLAAVLVRTFGGADDMRSPRAPGMLDALAHRPGLPADSLALVGWVAPSGVNRSGWLELAYRRAGADHDEDAQAFVARRRVAEHINARLPDWAMSAARAAGLDQIKDFEAALLRAGLFNTLGTETLGRKAMNELRPLVDDSRATVPNDVVELFAQIAATYAPDRARAAQRLLASRGRHNAFYVAAMAGEGANAAVAAAQLVFDGGLDSVDDGLSITRLLARAGRFADAARLLKQLVQWAPNSAKAWGGLADLAEGTAPQTDLQKQASLVALRRARELAPGDARYRAELTLRLPNEISAYAREDERYLVAPDVILARRKGIPTQGGLDAADRQLHWLRAVLFHPDRRISQLIHYAREILVEPQTQSDLIEDLPNEGDLTEIVRARVHRKDGGSAPPHRRVR